MLGWLREWKEVWPNPAPGSVEATFVLRQFLQELIGLILCDNSGYYVSFV